MGISGAKIGGAAGARGGMTLMDAWRLENRAEQIEAVPTPSLRNAMLSGTALCSAVGVAIVANSVLASTTVSAETWPTGAATTKTTHNDSDRTFTNRYDLQPIPTFPFVVAVENSGLNIASGKSVSGAGVANKGAFELPNAKVDNNGSVSSVGSSYNGVDVRAVFDQSGSQTAPVLFVLSEF